LPFLLHKNVLNAYLLQKIARAIAYSPIAALAMKAMVTHMKAVSAQ